MSTLRFTVLAATAALALGACTDSGTENPTPSELSGALLEVTDLSGDWAETQRQFFDERGPENPSLDPSVFCSASEAAGDALVELAGDAGADVEMNYRAVTDGARMMRLQAWSNDDVEDYFDALEVAVDACDGVTDTDESGATERFEIIEDREVGDESISWSTVGVPPVAERENKFESFGRTTVARLGTTIMVLQVGDAVFTGSAATLDEDAWWAIVTLAADKLADVVVD